MRAGRKLPLYTKDKNGNDKDRIPGFYIYEPTGMIHVRKTFKKLDYPTLDASTGESTLGRARSSAELLIQRWKNKHAGITDSHVYGGAVASRTFEAVALEVEKNRKLSDLRKMTKRKDLLCIPQLIEIFKNDYITAITPELFTSAMERERTRKKRPDEPVKRKTYFDFAKYMNLIMRYAYTKKYVTHLIQFKNPDKQKASGNVRVYTDKELRALKNAMSEMEGRILIQFILSYECFMRLREVLYLTWDRIDLKTGKITLRKEDVKTGSRTGKGREFIVSKNALALLRKRWKKRGTIRASPYVFPHRFDRERPQHENRSAWEIAKVEAGITGKATWHAIRHTALTKALLEKKLNPLDVSEYAGVAVKTIQTVYLHSTAEHTKGIAGALSLGEE